MVLYIGQTDLLLRLFVFITPGSAKAPAAFIASTIRDDDGLSSQQKNALTPAEGDAQSKLHLARTTVIAGEACPTPDSEGAPSFFSCANPKFVLQIFWLPGEQAGGRC
jgi:hypothetical protein